MGIPVLIARGPISVPCRIFTCSFEEAKRKMTRLLGRSRPIEPEDDENFTTGVFWLVEEGPDRPDEEEGGTFRIRNVGRRIIPISKLLTHYYGGCGGIHCFFLTEVEPETPFIGWDLD